MDQELELEPTDKFEEDIGFAEDQPLDLSILEKDEDVVKYFQSLLVGSADFYAAIKSKTYDKVFLSNTSKVYQYHYDIDCFWVSELIPNSEEDYVVLTLVDITETGAPIFNIQTTAAELSTINYLYTNYIKLPFYYWLHKKGTT